MSALIMTGQLLLALAILVGLHEFGHMITAKFFGMRVERFSIGFPPKVFGRKWGDTEYMIGAIPLGGFVKISGMMDESMDKEQMQKPPEPYEFRSKPAWQRLIVMLGGIIMNVITGIIIFAGMLWFIGETFIPASEIKEHGIVAHELAKDLGLQTGDKIVRVNGQDYDKFMDLTSPDVLLGSATTYTVKRGDSTFTVTMPADLVEKVGTARKAGQGFISPAFPYAVQRVQRGKPADKIGLDKGDVILSVNGKETRYFHQLREQLQANKGEEVKLKIKKADGEVVAKTSAVSDKGMLGFRPEMLLETGKKTYNPALAFWKGAGKAFSVVFVQIRAFGKMFRGEINAANSLSGPIGIAQQFGSTWDWGRFWAMTGLLSMVLAFMNLLPIPALDGGHVMFLIYEMVSGRKPGEKFMENAQKIGMAFLLLLMVFIIGKEAFEEIVKMIG